MEETTAALHYKTSSSKRCTIDMHLWSGAPVLCMRQVIRTAPAHAQHSAQRLRVKAKAERVRRDTRMQRGCRTSLLPRGPPHHLHAHAPAPHYAAEWRLLWPCAAVARRRTALQGHGHKRMCMSGVMRLLCSDLRHAGDTDKVKTGSR